jgi:Domain of unknown function (DUF6259)
VKATRPHSAYKQKLRLQLALACLPLLITAMATGQLLSGYSLPAKELVGPVQSLITTDPIWVVDYHTLVIDYRASGHLSPDAAVLTLRPGSVGPVTPRATNPENPFVQGGDIIAVRASDLILDGKPHRLSVDLRGKVKKPQVDALRLVLPAGARLKITSLHFLADPELLPCAASTPPEMPAKGSPLFVHGPLSCNGAPATSLRGRESISIDAAGKQGTTLYLDLLAFAYLPGFISYDASAPPRSAAINDPSLVVATVRYADRPTVSEEQFPLLVPQHRHELLNQKRSLYALRLDPTRRLLSVELTDRSAHAQLVLFRAAISDQAEIGTDEDAPVLSAAMSANCEPTATLSDSEWFHLADSAGKPVDTLQAMLHKTPSPHGLALSLEVTNNSNQDADVTLTFPSLTIHVSNDPQDVTYLFPQAVATISSNDATLSADYGPKFLLQFTDVFAPRAGCGAAVIVEDASGSAKTFALSKQNASVTDRTEYRIHLAAHQTYSAPPATVVLHNGDWRAGFHAYQHWLTSWDAQRAPQPAWLQRSFYMRRDYPIGGSGLLFDETKNRYTFDRLLQDGRSFGGIDFIDISGWALSEAKGRVGDYPIELGGPADLRANIEQAKREHVPTGLYFEGYLVDTNSDVGHEHGAQWQLVEKDGKGKAWPNSPEIFLCPHVSAWQAYLTDRVASVAKQTGAQAVYLDEFGCDNWQCYATDHGHAPGANMIGGQIAMAKQLRKTLDEEGLKQTILYTECPQVDIAAPYVDGSFTYALPSSVPAAYGAKLNLWRFAFPHARLWDMLSSGVEPHILSAEDFRFSFWHGDGVWLKGRSDTWYGQDILDFLRWAHPLLLKHAAAFAGEAEPLIDSPDPHILINQFRGGGEVVYTLFNNTYETRRLTFRDSTITLAPRGVDLVAEPRKSPIAHH